MLTHLLPGLRDLRAPLSAGFVWLVGIWLLAEPALRGEETELTASLDGLADLASPVAVGAGLAFVAYLLGSASEAAVAAVLDRVLRRQGYLETPRLSPASRLAVEELALEATWEAGRRLQARGISERDGFDTLTFAKSARRAAERRDQADAAARQAVEEGVSRSLVREDWEPKVRNLLLAVGAPGVTPARKADFVDAGWEGRDWYHVLVADILVFEITDEIEQIRTRLLVDAPDLFSKVDRLRAEAEFRAAIGLPLGFLAAVIAFGTGPWWLGLAIAALIPPLVLQGRRRALQSNDALVEALRIGKVGSPSLDSVQALGTQAWVEENWRQAEPARA